MAPGTNYVWRLEPVRDIKHNERPFFLFGIGSCWILLMHQWYDLSVYADARRRSQEEPGRATRSQQQPEEPWRGQEGRAC